MSRIHVIMFLDVTTFCRDIEEDLIHLRNPRNIPTGRKVYASCSILLHNLTYFGFVKVQDRYMSNSPLRSQDIPR